MTRPPSPSEEVRQQLADRRARAYLAVFALQNDWRLLLLTLLIERNLLVVEEAIAEVQRQRAADTEPG